jgi:hypothetical protein
VAKGRNRPIPGIVHVTLDLPSADVQKEAHNSFGSRHLINIDNLKVIGKLKI